MVLAALVIHSRIAFVLSLLGFAAALGAAALLPDAAVDGDAARALARQHPAALAEPRQLARFLCARASPATTRANLNRHGLWGALEGRRFADVLAWCEALKA